MCGICINWPPNHHGNCYLNLRKRDPKTNWKAQFKKATALSFLIWFFQWFSPSNHFEKNRRNKGFDPKTTMESAISSSEFIRPALKKAVTNRRLTLPSPKPHIIFFPCTNTNIKIESSHYKTFTRSRSPDIFQIKIHILKNPFPAPWNSIFLLSKTIFPPTKHVTIFKTELSSCLDLRD